MTDPIDTAAILKRLVGGSYIDTATIKALLDEINHLRAELAEARREKAMTKTECDITKVNF